REGGGVSRRPASPRAYPGGARSKTTRPADQRGRAAGYTTGKGQGVVLARGAAVPPCLATPCHVFGGVRLAWRRASQTGLAGCVVPGGRPRIRRGVARPGGASLFYEPVGNSTEAHRQQPHGDSTIE